MYQKIKTYISDIDDNVRLVNIDFKKTPNVDLYITQATKNKLDGLKNKGYKNTQIKLSKKCYDFNRKNSGGFIQMLAALAPLAIDAISGLFKKGKCIDNMEYMNYDQLYTLYISPEHIMAINKSHEIYGLNDITLICSKTENEEYSVKCELPTNEHILNHFENDNIICMVYNFDVILEMEKQGYNIFSTIFKYVKPLVAKMLPSIFKIGRESAEKVIPTVIDYGIKKSMNKQPPKKKQGQNLFVRRNIQLQDMKQGSGVYTISELNNLLK